MTTHRLIAPREFRRMPWKNGGGYAAEVAAWPSGSHDAFAWRVAIAEIERDGPFSSFPGVDRTFVLLDGEGVVLVHDDVEVALTVPHEPYRFSGDSACMCRLVGGPSRAYNLMVRRDRARGTLVVSDGAAAVPGPFRFGVCYAASGASECLLPGHAPIGLAPGVALVTDGTSAVASMHVNPVDGGAVAFVAALDADG
ncbi:MAG: HutD family protein [Vicinamibacteria bacterium]